MIEVNSKWKKGHTCNVLVERKELKKKERNRERGEKNKEKVNKKSEKSE